MVKIGVALGGGGSRGYAHFGALFALERSGIPIHCIAGTSMGAVVGALWATYQHIDCYNVLRKLDKAGVRDMLDPELPMITGFLQGRKLYSVLESWFKGYRLESLTRSFCANAVMLDTGEEVTFNSGQLSDVLRASVSVPVILSPWQIGESTYVDGGVVNPLPVRQCREMGADVVIAVNLLGFVPVIETFSQEQERIKRVAHRLHLPEEVVEVVSDIPLIHRLRNPKVPETAFAAVLISQRALVNANLREWAPDYLIQPDLSQYTGAEFHLVEEISDIGLEEAEKVIPEITRDLDISIQAFGYL
ncbi:MAG: patatin-like phospholipase family protein [Candidatus Sabulitectum sp.]|nr:patatin-like phospholipase family protein [Candidatus Sabulitectum sp.]